VCGELQQVVPVALFQGLDDVAYLLRAVAVGDEEGVRGIDHDQIPDADQSHYFAVGVHEVVVGVQRDRFQSDGIPLRVVSQKLVNGVPATHVVPAKVACRNARSEEHTSELQSPCNLVC